MQKLYPDGIHSISNSEYHNSKGISRSGLMQFKRSPLHFWYEYLSGIAKPNKDTPALVMGELVHTLTLEPELFSQRFIVMPDMDRRTKQGKLDYELFLKDSLDKSIINEDQISTAKLMANSATSNHLISSLIEDSKIEQSIYFTHATSGLQCKVRPDIWNNNIVADLKTSADAGFRAFQSSAFKYGYFLQAGLIQQALHSLNINLERFIFIVVEKDAPFCTALYLLDEEAIEWGAKQADKLLERIAFHLDKNEWPGYGVQNLTLPGYAKFDDLIDVV
jgi:exodeoxyribonuclease VIII